MRLKLKLLPSVCINHNIPFGLVLDFSKVLPLGAIAIKTFIIKNGKKEYKGNLLPHQVHLDWFLDVTENSKYAFGIEPVFNDKDIMVYDNFSDEVINEYYLVKKEKN